MVFTGSWIPDHELARLRGIEIDPQHRGPVVDSALRTTADGIFAAGNLLHPVDTADVAALDGRHVSGPVRRYLDLDLDPDLGPQPAARRPQPAARRPQPAARTRRPAPRRTALHLGRPRAHPPR